MTKTNRRLFPYPLHPVALLALLLAFAFMWNSSVAAADYYPPRVSHVDGKAAYIPAGKVDWEEVAVNIPLLNGDRVFAQVDSRLEIELGDANFLRLADETDLTLSTTLEKEIGLRLDEGVLILRLNKSRSVSIQTPFAVVTMKNKGLYRVGVDDSGQMQVIVRKGKAYIETSNGKQKLRDGEEIVLGARYQGPMQVSQYSYQDEFDRWSDRRDAGYMSSSSVSYVGGTYYPGVYELDRYGYWTSYPGYGRVWVPQVSFGWSPYRSGFWFNFGFGFGWTWISHEPWGWLPYHYGNWHYYHPHRRWCWIPGGFRSWAPHRAHFYHGGGYVGWAPRPYQFVNSNNVTVINNNTVINRPPREGLTVVRQEDFGTRRGPSDRSVSASRTVVENLRTGLPQDLPVTRRDTARHQVAGPTVTTPPSNARSVGRSAASRTQAQAVTRAPAGSSAARSVASGNSFTQRGTSRVLPAGGSRNSNPTRPAAVVTLPTRDGKVSPGETSSNIRNRGVKVYRTPTPASDSKARASRVTSQSTRVRSSAETPTRVVPRISRPASVGARSAQTPARNESGLRKGSGSSAPTSSIRSYGSRPANSNMRRPEAPSSVRSTRPSSSLNRSFRRPSTPSSLGSGQTLSRAPSSNRSFSGRAPAPSAPSRSYSRPSSSPARGGASGRSSAPSRGRSSGRSQRN